VPKLAGITLNEFIVSNFVIYKIDKQPLLKFYNAKYFNVF